MNKLYCTIILLVMLLAINYLYAGETLHLFKPDEKNLHEKLGISQQDWKEIQILIKAKNNYDLVCIEKQMHGFIGAWMSEKSEGKSTHGPVFFYNKHNGKWYELEEMSSWEK